MTLYFINKPKGRSMATRRKRRTAAQKRATAKMIAARKRQLRASNPPKRRKKRRKATAASKRRRKTTRTYKRRKPTVARSKRRRTRRPTTRRRRSTRRRSSGKRFTVTAKRPRTAYIANPRFSVRNIGKKLQQGIFDAAAVVGGKAATRVVANFLPLPKEGMLLNFATQAVAALGVGMIAQQIFSPQVARFAFAGGLAAPVETIMKQLPVVGDFLGDDYLELGAYTHMGAYPELAGYEHMGAYPQMQVVA